MNPDITPGARLPDYRLHDHAGEERALAELETASLQQVVADG